MNLIMLAEVASQAAAGNAAAKKSLRALSEYYFHIAANRYAESKGWKVFYIHQTGMMGADGNWKGMAMGGWPDSVYVRGPVMVCAEFKAERGKATPEQKAWLAALAGVPGVIAGVFKPRDAERLIEVLK